MSIIADDFGLNLDDNDVIVSLLESGVLDGTSVLIRGEVLKHVSILTKLREEREIDVGLHLNLTDDMTDQIFHNGIVKIWLKSMFGLLNMSLIHDELEAQLAMFKHKFGFDPDFIDGHQHCHAIPAVWPLLKKMISKQSKAFWVRSPCPKDFSTAFYLMKLSGLKSILIMYWGLILRKKLNQHEINTNSNFLGIISYKSLDKFESDFLNSLSKYNEDCVMMVHPGAEGAGTEVVGHPSICRAIEAKVLSKWSSEVTQRGINECK